MIIKKPFIIDAWEGNVVLDYTIADGWIFSASWTYMTEDAAFGTNWQAAIAAHKPRGAFFALFCDQSSADQAKFFVTILNKYGGVKKGDRLFVDAEVTPLSIGAIVDFMTNVETLCGLRPMIYSRADLLDPLRFSKLTASQKAYLLETPIWTAGYPDFPDQFATPPAAYIPDQTRFGKPELWQYFGDKNPASIGVTGITGGIDGSWVDPDFWAEWVADTGAVDVQPALSIHFKTFPQDASIDVVLRPSPTNRMTAMKVSDFSKQYALDWAVNANQFTYDPVLADIVYVSGHAVNKGQVISGDAQFEPDIIYISQANTLSWVRPALVYTAVSVNHPLVKDGVIVPGLDSSSYAARTIIAWNDTHFCLIVIDGIEGTTQGSTLQQAAEYCLAQGWTNAGNCDGGGSSAAASQGQLDSNPHDTNTPAVIERAVSTSIGVRIQTSNGGTMNTGDIVIATVNAGAQMSTRSTMDTTNSGIHYLQPGQSVTGVLTVKSATEQWITIQKCDAFPDAVGTFCSPLFNGKAFATVVPATPPPSGTPILTHTITIFSDGSVQIDGRAI